MAQTVTIFRNIVDTDTPFHRTVDFVLKRIKDGKSKELVKRIRAERNKNERNELKKGLPAVCFSGEFNKRNDKSLVQHSGIICLDFDGYDSKKELRAHKEILSKDRFVYSAFVSPSGNGMKVLVRVPADADNHVNYFNALQKHFDSPHFDKTCKNLSRVCYESWDNAIYINDNSSLWDKIDEPEYRELVTRRDPPTIPITDENKIVDILVKWWTKKYPMLEGQRNHNAFVLAIALNDYGINKSLASYVLNNYASQDFNEAEIQRTIDSAYEHTQNFGTKYYEDEDRVNSIRVKMKRGVSKKEIQKKRYAIN